MAATHPLIKKCAVEMAGSYYETAASAFDWWYKKWPSQTKFIKREWGNFIPTARDVLTSMLTMPGYSEVLKNEIYEALVADRSINQTTRGPGEMLTSFH